jgi:hypothetical protein
LRVSLFSSPKSSAPIVTFSFTAILFKIPSISQGKNLSVPGLVFNIPQEYKRDHYMAGRQAMPQFP